MSDAQTNAALNDLLILANRSLLQYAMECWPWSDSDNSKEQQAITDMAGEQQAVVARIAELLDHRQQSIDFGTFPDWSELHFVSLDYLLTKLIADEEKLVAAVDQAQPGLKVDPTASALGFDLLHLERQHLSRLRELAASRKAPVAVAS